MSGYYVTVYRDSTDLFTEEECWNDNMTELFFPKEVVEEWYYNNKEEFEEETSYELGKPVSKCTFKDWLNNVYTCDDTDGLYWFAVENGYTISRED